MSKRRAVLMIALVALPLCCSMCFFSCAGKKTQSAGSPDTGIRTKASQRPYTVMGTRYEPINSHEQFVQTGIASWYGKDFHGKKTSNGEIYNMHAMTAAHKTLPLGVFVKVYNKKNGTEAIVRVNDRGPFVKGRIIDVSYAAARKLGIDMTGTAFVRIEALGYQGGSVYEQPVYDRGNFTVQIGSFKDPANAQRLSERFKGIYSFTEIRQYTHKDELFYRVYVGKYASLGEAEGAEKKLAESGYPGCFTVSLD